MSCGNNRPPTDRLLCWDIEKIKAEEALARKEREKVRHTPETITKMKKFLKLNEK